MSVGQSSEFRHAPDHFAPDIETSSNTLRVALSDDAVNSKAALFRLWNRYEEAVRDFVRGRVTNNYQVEDLTQNFLIKMFVDGKQTPAAGGRRLKKLEPESMPAPAQGAVTPPLIPQEPGPLPGIQDFDPNSPKCQGFRFWMLSSLRNFIVDWFRSGEYQRLTRTVEYNEEAVASRLDRDVSTSPLEQLAAAEAELSPAEIERFSLVWAAGLVREVVQTVLQEAGTQGTLNPVERSWLQDFLNHKLRSVSEYAEDHGLSQQQVTTRMHTTRQRLRLRLQKALQEEMNRTLDTLPTEARWNQAADIILEHVGLLRRRA